LTFLDYDVIKKKMKVIATNKKAYHLYEIIKTKEAGIELKGSEVKSIREGKIQMKDAYGKVKNGELILYNMHISPYKNASLQIDPDRPRKLLFHKYEIRRIVQSINEKGMTLIPLKVYFTDKGRVKMEVGIARGKRGFEKRDKIIKKEMEMERRKYT